jgi:hypothetical protein
MAWNELRYKFEGIRIPFEITTLAGNPMEGEA